MIRFCLRQSESLAFVTVGAVAAAVHLTSVLLIVQLLHVAPQWANPAAFVIAFSVSYSGHYGFTFRANRAPRQRTLGRWLAVSVGGFLANQTLYVLALRWVPQLHYLLLLFVVTGIVTLVTYLLGKYWAFAATQAGHESKKNHYEC